MDIARPRRPRPPWRWVAYFGARLWEYRERDAGPCVGCGKPTQWIHVATREAFVLAVNVSAAHNVPLGRALHVPGVGRDGRVTCSTCRGAGARMILEILAAVLAFASGWTCSATWIRKRGRAVAPCVTCRAPCFPSRLCPSCDSVEDARRACAPKG